MTLANCFPGASQASHRAFDELSDILRRYAASILARWGYASPWVHAEDVVNDLFLRFLERNLAHRYNGSISQRRTYLFGVLRRVLAESYRRHKPNRTVPLPEDLFDTTPSPDEAAAMLEIRDRVSAAIGRLRPRLAGAVRCKYGFELLSEDIVALSPSARDSRTSRARKALRQDLQGLMDC
jgi:RNA polymerase sigma factor (sigma-70 family)